MEAHLCVLAFTSREILDQQDGAIEDDGLTGLLRLATSVLKHKPPFKFSREGQEFLRDVHNLLFLLPSLADRAQPKCKSHASRAAAYDLLVETVKGSMENYRLLHNWVMSQHMQSESPALGCSSPLPHSASLLWPILFSTRLCNLLVLLKQTNADLN